MSSVDSVLNSLLHAFLEQMNSFEAQNGKYDSTGVDGGEAIADGDDNDILDAVFLGIVVGAKADD